MTQQSYGSLITAEHSQRPKFMAMVNVVTGAIANVTGAAQALQPAFDLDLAVGAQLDIIGLWVGQSRVINGVLIVGFFGFQDDVAASTFGELPDKSIGGRFYELNTPFSGTTILDDPTYRTILKARIVRNQSNGTLMDIESSLQYVFGVPSKIVDGGTLSLAITVGAPITPTESALLNALDLLPRPAGVAIGSITYAP